jgi:hypothetical protein
LDTTDLPRPGIEKLSETKPDWLNTSMMERVKVTHNIFLEFHGGKSETELTIIPVEVQVNFWGAFRKGIGSKNGHSQEFAS